MATSRDGETLQADTGMFTMGCCKKIKVTRGNSVDRNLKWLAANAERILSDNDYQIR